MPSVQFDRAAPTKISDNALVENRITGLLSQDNPYMQKATTRGNQEAQRRGLLSSSIAAGAVENSRIEAALPIAQQDAQTYSNADLQDSAYNQQVSLNDQGYNQQLGLNKDQYGYDSKLSAQGFNQDRTLQKDQFGYNRTLQKDQFGFNRTLQKDQFGYDSSLSAQGYQQDSKLSSQGYTQNKALQTDQYRYDSALNSANNAAQSSLQQNNQIAELQLNANSQIASIEQNPNMSEDSKSTAIKNVISLNNASITSIRTGQRLSTSIFSYPPSAGGGAPSDAQKEQITQILNGPGSTGDKLKRIDQLTNG